MKIMKIMHTGFYLTLLMMAAIAHADDAKISAETLMEAISQNDEAMVSKILAHDEAKNFDKYSLKKALESAADNNNTTIARILIQAGADIKGPHCFAFENAAENGYVDMIKILLPVQGCQKHYYTGRSPLRQLVATDDYNYTCDMALIKAAKHGHVGVMQELIQAGASVDQPDLFGEIALVAATKNGHVGAVKELIKANVKVNAANSNGSTALSVAVALRNPDLIRELLMAKGIDVSWEVSGIQRDYEDYLAWPDSFKEWRARREDHLIDLKIYELFKPFMKLKTR